MERVRNRRKKEGIREGREDGAWTPARSDDWQRVSAAGVAAQQLCDAARRHDEAAWAQQRRPAAAVESGDRQRPGCGSSD
ncbi:hypothetical protein Scep_001573 [Stephania cephalantha]|uniref:Uncharacterized protein n=1 Tax=Stephania cephalantha TaxID=152367 RepID=A0AAP0L9N5_9MAGN